MTPFRWSFSQWETYNSCPAKWKYRSVLKLPGLPPGPAAARGSIIHDTVEKYIMGEHGVEGLHAAVKPMYLPVLDEFRNSPQKACEQAIRFGPGWGISSVENVWCLMFLDAVRIADWGVSVGEWKSGKPKDTHGDQRKLYALGTLLENPGVDYVEATTHYLEGTAPSEKLQVRRSAVDKLKALWNGRVEQMQGDQICAPKPGRQCNWCDYSKRKGGPCPFGA